METVLKAQDVGIKYVVCSTVYDMCAVAQMALNAGIEVPYTHRNNNSLIDFNSYEADFRKGLKIVVFTENRLKLSKGYGIIISKRYSFKDWFKIQLITLAEMLRVSDGVVVT